MLWAAGAGAVRERRPHVRLCARRAAASRPQDVKLVRRSESQVVIEGLDGRAGRSRSRIRSRQEHKQERRGSAMQAILEVMFAPLRRPTCGWRAGNLRAQKTRTLLTALGIVFGVGSVIGMLAIGAGARDESLRFIEQLGVRNLLIDSRPATSQEELQQRRRSSPGLTERDVRILKANIERSGADLRAAHAASGARASQARARYAGAVRRARRVRADSQPAAGGRQRSSTTPTTRRAPRSACWARRPRSTCSATARRWANSSR